MHQTKVKLLPFHEVRKKWSIWVAAAGVVFWGALFGLWTLWPAFIDQVPLWFYMLGGIGISVALAVARALKQPGLE